MRMEDRHLDHPDEVHWWRGQGPAEVIGPCPHTCDHRSQRTLAWGPDLTRYELVRCDDACEGTCRAWTDGGPDNTTQWLHVDVPARPVSCPCRVCAGSTTTPTPSVDAPDQGRAESENDDEERKR